MAISGGDVSDQDVIDILGVIEEEIFISLTKNIFEQDRKELIQQIHSLSERGMDLRFFYNEYLKFFRDLMVLKSLGESDRLHNLNPENIPQLKDILKNVREVELLRYFNAAKDLEQTMRNTENPRIILEYLFLKLSYFPSLMSIEDLIKKTKSGQWGGGKKPAETKPGGHEQGAAVEAVAAVEPGLPAETFNSRLIETIGKEKLRLASALGSSAITLENNTLNIKFPKDLVVAYKNVENHIDYLKETIYRLLKRRVDVSVTLDTNSSRSEEEARKKELENDEKIKGLADKIKGKMVSIEKI